MKTYSIIAAAAIAFAFAQTAFAQEATYELPQPVASAKSRAGVNAEVLQARADGTLHIGEADWPRINFVAQKSRSEVRAETQAAAVSGELRALHQEIYDADGRLAASARRVVAPMVTASK